MRYVTGAIFQGLIMVIGGLLVNAEEWGEQRRGGSVTVRGAMAPLPPPPPLPLARARKTSDLQEARPEPLSLSVRLVPGPGWHPSACTPAGSRASAERPREPSGTRTDGSQDVSLSKDSWQQNCGSPGIRVLLCD